MQHKYFTKLLRIITELVFILVGLIILTVVLALRHKLFTTNHNYIGLLLIITSCVFIILGVILLAADLCLCCVQHIDYKLNSRMPLLYQDGDTVRFAYHQNIEEYMQQNNN